MIAHSVSRRSARALPRVESTVLIEGIDKKVIKCKARKAFTVNNSHIKEGETFFLVASERRANRYYVVHYNSIRNAYQCSCGCNMCEHEHLKVVREYVMSHIVAPAKSSEAIPMTIPATVAEVKAARKAKVEQEPLDGSKVDWKAVMKADRARQRAWAKEYREQAMALREQSKREMEVAG